MRPFIAFALAFFLVLAPLGAAEPLYHVLEKGETVYAVAREYKVTPEALLKANGITDPTKLKAGQRLLIPRNYIVKKGDTLFGIARSLGVSVDDLRAANGLAPNAMISAGQVLNLPATADPGSGQASDAASGKGTAPADGKASGSGKGLAPISTTDSKDQLPASLFPPLVRTSSKAVDGSLVWPCSGEARYLDGKLEGIMFLTEKGVANKAVASGKVVSAGPYRGFGQVVLVEARSGYMYVYGGNDSLEVHVGDTVRPGQELGRVGYDAKEGRAVSYFIVFRNGESLDPAKAPRG
jgi:LysM repeat protein